MAKAPVPGSARQRVAAQAEREAAQYVYRLRVKDEILNVPTPAMLPIKEKIAVRWATGLPYEAFMSSGQGSLGEDSLVVLWWLGRRAAGEPTLSFQAAVDQWPIDLTGADIDVDLIDVNAEETEVDNPET